MSLFLCGANQKNRLDKPFFELQIIKLVIYKPFFGLYKSKKGLHKPKKSLHKSKKGLYKPKKGLHKSKKGLHKPKMKGFAPKKPLKRAENEKCPQIDDKTLENNPLSKKRISVSILVICF